jgi:hypothetical protein
VGICKSITSSKFSDYEIVAFVMVYRAQASLYQITPAVSGCTGLLL